MKPVAERHPYLCGTLVLFGFAAILLPKESAVRLAMALVTALLIIMLCVASASLLYGAATLILAGGRKGIDALFAFFKRSART